MQNRYMEYNMNSNSYTWKALIHGKFIALELEKTMVDNGIQVGVCLMHLCVCICILMQLEATLELYDVVPKAVPE
jgi:hypothetical protein